MSKAQFRILMLVTVISGLVGGALVSWLFPGRAAFAQGGTQKVVTAQKFRLVDSEGKGRAALWVDDDRGPGLVLYDATGKERVRLDNGPGPRPGLTLRDATGEVQLTLFVGGAGQPTLSMGGIGRAEASLSIYDQPILSMKDSAWKERVLLGLRKDDTPGLILWDADGKVCGRL